MANIYCDEAAELIAEAGGASCKSTREKNLLEVGLLWRALTNACSFATPITADNAFILADITAITADMNQFMLTNACTSAIPITSDNTFLLADTTLITADMTEFL